MSDGMVPGSMSLEQPDTEGATAVGVISDPAVPVTDAEESEPEGTITTQKGEKLVPIGAVIAERGRRKDAERSAKDKDDLIGQLKPKADRYDQVEPQIRAAMPIIEKIRNRPDLIKLADQPREEPGGPLTKAEAIEYAKNFDLFLPDGTPDIDRAQRIETFNQQRTQKAVREQMAPLVGHTATQQSNAFKQQYAALALADGTKVDQRYLDQVWANVPPEMAANPDVARILYLASAGLERVSSKTGARPGPVVQTEGVGGRQTQAPAITDLDTSIMKSAGISQKTYKETSARFKPGQSNSLE